MRLGFWKILNDPKSKIFLLLQITQNGQIRENKWLKPKSGTFFCHFWMTLALQCLEAFPDLVIFRQIFRKNFFCSKCLIMVQFAKKSGRNRNLRISPSQWVPGLPIFKNEDFVDFFDFGWLDMVDIAYSSSTNGYLSLDNHQLPDMRVKSCKMRPILLKKSQNLDFWLFFRFWVPEYAWYCRLW